MKLKISFEEIRRCLDIETPEFPKYAAPLINLANQYAQGTRPRTVGQMSQFIQQFTGKEFPEWEEWYSKQKPEAIRASTEKILRKLEEFKIVLDKIDKEIVERWVKDLVLIKTFIGLRFQEAVLKKGAEIKGADYRLSTREEEAKGIDGYIGAIPVSIKPVTYKVKASLPESISAKIIYYRKVKDGIEVDYGEVL